MKKRGNHFCMKKMIAFILILCCLVSVFQFSNNQTLFGKFQNAASVCLIAEESFDFAQRHESSGDKIFNYCSLTQAKENFEHISEKLEGVQLYFEDMSALEILQKLQIAQYSQMEMDGMVVYLAYTTLYDDFVLVDGKKINVQIVEKDGQVVCGFPAIITGY